MKYEIYDNFLSKEYHQTIYDMFVDWHFSWHLKLNLNNNQIDNDKSVYFTHSFYYEGQGASKNFEKMKPLLNRIKHNYLIRMVGNLYTSTNDIIKHANHVDFDVPHTTCLYYINNNNGKTILNDKVEVESVANRLLVFDGLIPHCSTTCSNEKVRMNVNVNVR